jgi:hypothetical protein
LPGLRSISLQIQYIVAMSHNTPVVIPLSSQAPIRSMPGTKYTDTFRGFSSTSCYACLSAFSRGNSSFICLISLDAPNPDLGSCYPRLSTNATSRTGKDGKSSLTGTPDSGKVYRVNVVPRQSKGRYLPRRTPRSEANIHGPYGAPSTCRNLWNGIHEHLPRKN